MKIYWPKNYKDAFYVNTPTVVMAKTKEQAQKLWGQDFILMNIEEDRYSWEFSGWYGGGQFKDLEFDPYVKNRVYLCSNVNGFFRSDNLGETWRSMNIGLTNLNVTGIFVDKGIIYLTTSDGNFSSRNAGELWAPISRIPQPTLARYDYSSLDHANPIPGVLIKEQKNTSQGIFIGGTKGSSSSKVYFSVDGKVWLPKNNMTFDYDSNPTREWITNAKFMCLRVNPFNEKCLFRTDNWGVFRSDDSGDNWSEKIKGAANAVGSDILAFKDTVFVATMDNGLLKSTDAGFEYSCSFPKITTANIETMGHVWRIESLGGDKLIATSSPWNVDRNQIILSNDAGTTWKIVPIPGPRPKGNALWGQGYPRALAVDPHNPNNVYVGVDGNGGGIFISHDGGQTFTRPIVQPGSLRIYNALAIDPRDTSIIYWGAVGTGGGIYRSDDLALSWKKVFQVSWAVYDLKITSDGIIYAGCEGPAGATLFSSKDGNIWSIVNVFDKHPGASVEAIALDPRNLKRLAVSVTKWSSEAPGSLWLSNDRGETWINITNDLPVGNGAAAMTFSGDILWVNLMAGGVWKVNLK